VVLAEVELILVEEQQIQVVELEEMVAVPAAKA
jgi:hypothetical protein